MNRAKAALPLLLLILCFGAAISEGQIITTIAGNGTPSFTGDGQLANTAAVNSPYGVGTDNNGNVYIADYGNNRIRKINSSGVINTVSGCGNITTSCIAMGDFGPATAALTLGNWDVVADAAGNFYFTDSGNSRIRKVDSSGTITTFAGGGASTLDGVLAITAKLSNPIGLAIDSSGNIYVAEVDGNRVRKISTAGTISTIAGTGTAGFSGDGAQAARAQLNNPHGVGVDAAGNVYIADTNNFVVRKVDTSGIITTVAGQVGKVGQAKLGTAANSTTLSSPWDVKADASGNFYIADWLASRVYKVDTSGIINNFAGTGTAGFSGDGGPAASAAMNTPNGLAIDNAGNVYIADSQGNRVRKVSAAAPSPPSITSNGVVNGASFQPGIVPGSWATIQGTNLSAIVDTWANSIVNGKLPTTLDGVTVKVGVTPGYVYYVSPTQINFIVPEVGPGPMQVTVTTSAGTSAPINVTSSTYGPAFFTWPGNQAVATRQDFSLAAKAGTFATQTIPAKPGDTIILWGTGFGPTNPAYPPGTLVPSTATYSTGTSPVVTVNGVAATVYGAALAPGFAGLYQVAIQVPTTLADGDWPVQATMGTGSQSPSGVILSVKH